MLRLFVSFLKKIDTEENVSLNINIGLTKYFEEIVEEKENVLKKIKEIKKIIWFLIKINLYLSMKLLPTIIWFWLLSHCFVGFRN